MKKATAVLVGLLVAAILPFAPPKTVHAGFGSAGFGSGDFLKTSGKFIRNNSGSGSIVTLRGVNLGGWLAPEDWMNPPGEFALDPTRWTATASVNRSTAGHALDGRTTTRRTTRAPQAGGHWFQGDMSSPAPLNRDHVATRP